MKGTVTLKLIFLQYLNLEQWKIEGLSTFVRILVAMAMTFDPKWCKNVEIPFFNFLALASLFLLLLADTTKVVITFQRSFCLQLLLVN